MSSCLEDLIVIPLSGGPKVTERLSVSKQASQKFDMVTLNLRKLNDVEVIEQVNVSNRFEALGS
jgi:hypothetical protein